MRQGRWIVGLAVVAACTPLSVAAAASSRATGTTELMQFLPHRGEMPGFKPQGSIYVATTIARDVAEDSPANKKADAANLLKDGFRAEVFQGQAGAGKTNGVAGVTELKSPAAAAAYRKFDFGTISTYGPVAGTTAQIKIVRFSVPGVAGAEGAALISRSHVVADANIEWVQGDCVMAVGDAVAGRTPLEAPLIAAAQAIADRTKQVCVS